MTAVGEAAAIPPDLLLTEPRSPRRWIALPAATAWLAVALMDLATAWATYGTDYFRVAAAASGTTPSPDQVLIINAAIGAFLVITIGYTTVGALLAGRVGAGRIAATLLLGRRLPVASCVLSSRPTKLA
jgi:ABC-type Na+ efflux pump permease subunit